MANPQQHGRSTTLGADADEQRKALSGRLGDSNIEKQGIGFGKVEHGQAAGKLDAVYAKLNLVAATNVYTVGHTLDHVPGFVLLVGSNNLATPASHYSVIPWEPQKWTRSTVRVRVDVVVGALAGGQVLLMIGGT